MEARFVNFLLFYIAVMGQGRDEMCFMYSTKCYSLGYYAIKIAILECFTLCSKYDLGIFL